MKSSHCAAWLLTLLLLIAKQMHAGFTLNSGFDYSTGDYGLPVSTEIITIPFSVSYAVNRTTWEMSLPHLRIDGPGEVVPGIGRLVRRQLRARSTNEGVGDLTFRVSHELAGREGNPWTWVVGAEMKLGTANATKSLGTGENDHAMQVEVYYSAGRFTPFATLGYRKLGNPPGSDLRDFAYGTAGLNWACTERVTLAVLVDGAARSSAGGSSTTNWIVSISRPLGERWHAQLYGVWGTSDASADNGGGLGLSRSF